MSNPNNTARDIYGALNAALAEYDLEPVDMVAVLTDLATMLEDERRELIYDARHARVSWEQIGIALRTTRQAAQQRYGIAGV